MAEDLEIDGDDRPITSQFGRGQPSRRSKWTRRILTIGIALGALTAFVVIVFSAYDHRRQPAGDRAAPVIRAEDGPMKIRPKQPGGMDVPNQDKQVYGRISPIERPPQVEHLIPPPEVDVARPPPPPPSPQTAAVPAPPPTVVSRPPEPIEKPALAVAAPPPTAAAAPEPLPAPVKAKAPPQPPAHAASAPRAATSPKPARAAGGRYRIQLASLRSETAAKSTWARLSKRDADLFGGLRSSVVRVDLGRKGVFYRLQAGPLADEAAARALCGRVKQRKLGCIVVRP